MNALFYGWALLGLVSSPPRQELTYGFATQEYLVYMSVSFLNPAVGRPLIFYSSFDPQKPVCYSGDAGSPGKCAEQFVGAAAIVKYTVKQVNGQPPTVAAIRERVIVVSQSPGLPERAPFSKTQALVKGTGSDIQVFGYDEALVNKAERARTRQHSKRAWRLYRQELYIDQERKPFAVVEWKHTFDRISIERIYAPPDRERDHETMKKWEAAGPEKTARASTH